MGEQHIADKEKLLEMAETMLRDSGIINSGLKQIKKQMGPGLPYQALKLLSDPDRIDKLITALAELYVDIGLTAEDLELITQFQCSDVGRKLASANMVIQPKSVEVTQEWVYNIMEEVQDAEKHQKADGVIKVKDTGDIPDIVA